MSQSRFAGVGDARNVLREESRLRGCIQIDAGTDPDYDIMQRGIEHRWVQLGLDAALYEHYDAAVVNAIARVTAGNFRLVQRLFAQIERFVSRAQA